LLSFEALSELRSREILVASILYIIFKIIWNMINHS
jgi:hypothetical protein